MKSIVVVAGGADPQVTIADIGPFDTVIAADAGLHHAHRLGLPVDRLVGDLDSVGDDDLERARAAGVAVHAVETDKDFTDLDMALGIAVELGATRIVVIGALGGRLDHLMANMALLASPRFAAVAIELIDRDHHVWVVRDRVEIDVAAGTGLTLLAASPVTGLTTRGVRWELADASLEPGSTHGVSNVVVSSPVEVRIASGALFAISY